MKNKLDVFFNDKKVVNTVLNENEYEGKKSVYVENNIYSIKIQERNERSLLIGEKVEQYLEELISMDIEELKNKKETIYCSGKLSYYPQSKILMYGDKEIVLDRGELIIFNKFITHPNMVIVIDKIMDSLSMALGKNVSEESAKRELGRLRKKLNPNDAFSYIETRYGIGYKWRLPVEKKLSE